MNNNAIKHLNGVLSALIEAREDAMIIPDVVWEIVRNQIKKAEREAEADLEAEQDAFHEQVKKENHDHISTQ